VQALEKPYNNSLYIQVTGVVTDQKGEPLPGISILEQGTNNGTVSDIDGKFNISVSFVESILIFSFIGYQRQEVGIGSNTILEVSMVDDMQNLSEIVVVGRIFLLISPKKFIILPREAYIVPVIGF
jgi:hypothetical protein